MQQWIATKLTVSVNTIPISHFADGVMFSASYVEDQNSVSTGADGKSRHVGNPSRAAVFKIRTKMGSPAQDILQTVFDLDLPVPIIAIDGSSKKAAAKSQSCKLKKVPDWERALEEGVTEWEFNALDATIIHSGAKD